MVKRTTMGILVIGAMLTIGCKAMLSGAGEVGMGHRSETKLFVYHTTDKALEGTESMSEMDVQSLMDFIAEWRRGELAPSADEDTSDSE